VAETPDIATFCSQSAWQLSALRSLQQEEEVGKPLIIEENGNWLLFVERVGTGIYYPWEAAWMFGSPLIGCPASAVDLLWRTAGHFSGRVGFLLSGIPAEGELYRELSERRATAIQWQEFPGTDCMRIDLTDGFESWLQRRSPKFRKTVRQLKVPDRIEKVEASEDSIENLLDRILAIQRQTYKWQEGTDILQSPSHLQFYTQLLADLQRQSRLRIWFARDGEKEIAYQVGAIGDGRYRGLQMSYIEEVRSWGLGNWLQLENLRHCAEEGITEYDLGMHSDYKERWVDRQDEFRVVFVVPGV
jgi:CelD/BcsL family acetyltransferase involved in cellulose biosynthesis